MNLKLNYFIFKDIAKILKFFQTCKPFSKYFS